MLKRKKGNIINVASAIGVRATLNRAAYSVAKAGVIMLTRVLARELGSYNIRVNAIAPWVVKTRMNEDLLSDPDFTKAALANTPLGRFGETDDITGAALFLASDAASWITGQIVVVDGGYIA
jgi:NAD(P)-dependent dehydrogenase (short-subunit alcohol dehydrogenase family)